MQVINLPAGQANVLKLSGEIDCHVSPRFHAILRLKLKEKHPLLLLDCSELDCIDSCGMAALIEYVRDAKKFGGRLALVALKPNLKSILQMVHLDEHLLLYKSVMET